MTFKFSPVMLKAIHRELFTGVLSEEITGEWKNCNLTKAEAVLGGQKRSVCGLECDTGLS